MQSLSTKLACSCVLGYDSQAMNEPRIPSTPAGCHTLTWEHYLPHYIVTVKFCRERLSCIESWFAVTFFSPVVGAMTFFCCSVLFLPELSLTLLTSQ